MQMLRFGLLITTESKCNFCFSPNIPKRVDSFGKYNKIEKTPAVVCARDHIHYENSQYKFKTNGLDRWFHTLFLFFSFSFYIDCAFL